jgi:hypothetical protein
MARGQPSRKAANNSRQTLKNYYGVSKPLSSRNHSPISTSQKPITIIDLTNAGPQQGSQVSFDRIPPTRITRNNFVGDLDLSEVDLELVKEWDRFSTGHAGNHVSVGRTGKDREVARRVTMGEDIGGEGFNVANVRPATQKTEPLGKFRPLSFGVLRFCEMRKSLEFREAWVPSNFLGASERVQGIQTS